MTTDTPRRIVLVRHAKAEWNDGDDHERPLADRGRKDAPAAGRWLAGSGVTPGLPLVTWRPNQERFGLGRNHEASL
ncbi:SixA phosphatase family protein [Nonomuraea sp. NPDC050451]|uniref:SixA phosphatase family protein n=1 Tax=Nonomuraea sp. NPDC050451 TaxID=3364364 RepID=UPI0037B95806